MELILESSASILIAHRLSTVRKADHIIGLEEGCTIEEERRRLDRSRGPLRGTL